MNQCRSNHSVQPLGKKVILNEFSVVDNTKSLLFRAKVECFSQGFFKGWNLPSDINQQIS